MGACATAARQKHNEHKSRAFSARTLNSKLVLPRVCAQKDSRQR